MGKWADRLAEYLAEKNAAPPMTGTAKTVKRGLSSVLAVGPEGGAGVFCVPSDPTAETASSAGPVDPRSAGWTDADVARYLDRRARLLRWGWPEADAERLAERLALRDLDDRDDRVSCVDCRHYRPCRCGNHRAAGLNASDVARDFAELLQRCPGHEPIGPER